MAITYHSGKRSQGLSLENGLIAHLNFNYNVTDSAGSNDGTVTGTTTYATGKNGKAFSFNGASEVVLANESNFDFDITDPFSVSAWYKADGGTDDIIVSKYQNGASHGWELMIDGSGMPRFSILAGGSGYSVAGSSVVNDNNWHHIVGTFDGSSNLSGVTLITDGTTITGGSNAMSSNSLNSYPVRIGAHGQNIHNPFTGLIDDVRIYNRKLTSTETSGLYNSGNGIEAGEKSTLLGIATSGSITIDGSDTILTFTEDGTFTPSSTFDVEYLVVAGGAGGGGSQETVAASGGGAGGFRTATGFEVTAQNYNITVGIGGQGGYLRDHGTNGTNSVFSSITSTGGGGGGAMGVDAKNGGSGGGSRWYGAIGNGNTPSTDPSQGNNGGLASSTGLYQGGAGGGGSSAVGAGITASDNVGANGGNGTASSITGSSVTYAGGGAGGGGCGTTPYGAGGTGGSGGGGNGGAASASGANGVSGTHGLGAGGGGASGSTPTYGLLSGGNGGNGIVIIKFPTSGNSYSTSLSSHPVPTGSRFEETDTRKFYTKDLNGWQEKGTALGYRHDSTYAQNQPAEANPFTTINKQHFVEWFSGKQIPSYWNTYINSSGSGTITMSDEADGGLEIDTVGSNGDWIRLDFGRKNQYSKTGAIAISVFKLTNVNGAGFQVGFYNGGTSNTQQPYYSSTSHATIFADPAQNSNFCGSTGDGSSTIITLGTAIDTNWHTGKVECGSDYKFYLDGVLGTTITSTLPDVNLEPAIFARTPSSLNHSPVHIRYYEAYNT